MTNSPKSGGELTFEQLANWLERNCHGFYGGCRIDQHSPQVREFVDHLHYYIEKDFGYTSERQKLIKERQK